MLRCMPGGMRRRRPLIQWNRLEHREAAVEVRPWALLGNLETDPCESNVLALVLRRLVEQHICENERTVKIQRPRSRLAAAASRVSAHCSRAWSIPLGEVLPQYSVGAMIRAAG